jgi:hypothetical protein
MSNKIEICKGAGCKAWNSEYLVKKLRSDKGSEGVCLVSCMQKCGGGASLKFKGQDEVLKLRETHELTSLLGLNTGSMAATC